MKWNGRSKRAWRFGSAQPGTAVGSNSMLSDVLRSEMFIGWLTVWGGRLLVVVVFAGGI